MATPKNPHTRAANTYANRITGGKKAACKWVKLACRRHLDDLEKAKRPGFRFRFDVEKAERACRAIELFPHIKGRKWAGTLITLEPWQKFIVCSIFGWVVAATGLRRFKTAYIEVPRKNAKSTLAAAIALYMLACDEEPGAEIYSVATTRDQARIVFAVAASMALKTPEYRRRFGVHVGARALAVYDSQSSFLPLSAESSNLDGLNVHLAIIDELHAHKTRAVFDVIETATGAREQPLIFIITTAGTNTGGVCYEQRIYLTKILQGLFEDDSYFGLIYTIDDDDSDKWHLERIWKKANPNYGVSVIPDDLKRLAVKARNSPQSENNFRTKRLDEWVGAGAAWLNMSKWRALMEESPGHTREDFLGMRCFGGLDLASKKDVNAFGLLFEVDGRRIPLVKYYMPEERVNDLKDRSLAHFDAWAREGWLTLTPGNVIDFNIIEEDVRQAFKDFDLEGCGYDPYQATQLAVTLFNEGCPMIEYGQTVKNFSQPAKEFESWLLDGTLDPGKDPVLAWMASNVCVKVDKKENIFPFKETAEANIDGIISLLMCVGQVIGEPESPGTIYDSGDVGVLSV